MITKKRFDQICAGVPYLLPSHIVEHLYVAVMKELEGSETASPAHAVIAYFASEFQERFGRRPLIEGKDAKRLKENMRLNGLTVDATKALVLSYLGSDDPAFKDKGHTFFTFLNSMERLNRRVQNTGPRPVRLPTTSKPTLEIDTPSPIEPILRAPPPDVAAQLKRLSLGAATSRMPETPKAVDPEERRQQLRQQADELEKKGRK